MINSLQKVFIVIYLGVLLFCIFLRVESWPFSDYRFYAYDHHPRYVRAVIPYFKLSDGSYFNPGTTNFIPYAHVYYTSLFDLGAELTPFIDRIYFSYVFLSDSSDKNRYVNKILKSELMQKTVKDIKNQGFLPVKFVAMQVTFKEETKHKWMPVYTPWEEYDIP